MIIDTHAHFSDHRFDEDRHEALQAAHDSGVELIVEVGAGFESTRDALKLASQYDYVYAAVGIHPDEVEQMKPEDIEWLRGLCSGEKVVAVGEIGLDYHYEDGAPREVQMEWFRRQIQLAREVDKPVIIHSREAAQDTLQIMQEEEAGRVGGVVHCFGYSVEMARIYVKMGFYIGVGGVVTFKNARKLREVVEDTPLSRIVLETDTPYMAPEPHRGKRNTSAYLPYVAAQIAQIKGVTPEEVIRCTADNARNMYRLG